LRRVDYRHLGDNSTDRGNMQAPGWLGCLLAV
jgi:hypothetical protein